MLFERRVVRRFEKTPCFYFRHRSWWVKDVDAVSFEKNKFCSSAVMHCTLGEILSKRSWWNLKNSRPREGRRGSDKESKIGDLQSNSASISSNFFFSYLKKMKFFSYHLHQTDFLFKNPNVKCVYVFHRININNTCMLD